MRLPSRVVHKGLNSVGPRSHSRLGHWRARRLIPAPTPNRGVGLFYGNDQVKTSSDKGHPRSRTTVRQISASIDDLFFIFFKSLLSPRFPYAEASIDALE
jgi:hypothetical protein